MTLQLPVPVAVTSIPLIMAIRNSAAANAPPAVDISMTTFLG
jgi:hypothetical protein